MPTKTLQHCVPYLASSSESPADVDLDISVGGSVGDGTVVVTAAPNATTPTTSVATDTAELLHAAGCTSITLHYHESPGGPDSVSVTYTVIEV